MTTFFGGSWQPHLFILPVDYLNKTLKVITGSLLNIISLQT